MTTYSRLYSRTHLRSHAWPTTRTCLSRYASGAIRASVPVAALTLSALLGATQVHADDAPTGIATMLIGGNYFPRDLSKSNYTILATFLDSGTSEAGASGDAPAGGMAVFGWFESGQVQLLHAVEYLPSMTQMSARRNVKPAKFPLDPKATPLYAMVCAWSLDDQRMPGTITVAYAERDDANSRVKKSSVGTLLTAHWVPIPASRAAKRFEAMDYCAEVAKTKKSSAALWLTTTTD